MFDIIHLATAKWSEAAKQSAAAPPAEGDTAAYLSACHLVAGRCLPLSVAVGAGELHGGSLTDQAW